ncbi:hypothetical protein FA09DRAFT_340837 [Tilletiopsis washingtonensis]|jgi:hypothetical protein|uniref:Uncharacterized protein n=1 Tax=Tilletiopsis washingtonensis TaxID=58919 RepID=A0A316Z4P6_9BASI|nr:hypothetical protein FA09DRAFT_340837 [Tilletiopsis washingtonensis]PWN95902.1 hypothetical protein FA09DRAFT_340837 [Tilletiopsis washingtonensis]
MAQPAAPAAPHTPPPPPRFELLPPAYPAALLLSFCVAPLALHTPGLYARCVRPALAALLVSTTQAGSSLRSLVLPAPPPSDAPTARPPVLDAAHVPSLPSPRAASVSTTSLGDRAGARG